MLVTPDHLQFLQEYNKSIQQAKVTGDQLKPESMRVRNNEPLQWLKDDICLRLLDQSANRDIA